MIILRVELKFLSSMIQENQSVIDFRSTYFYIPIGLKSLNREINMTAITFKKLLPLVKCGLVKITEKNRQNLHC